MRDIILDKLREMMKPAKVKKTKPFTPSKKDIEAHGNEIQRREDAREPSDRDAEIDQMAKDYGYGKKEEAIAFPKTTTRGKAARATAADTLRDVKSRMQKSGLAKKPGDAAKLTKQFSKENYKQRESLISILADKIEELKQSTVDSAAKKRVAQVRSKDFSGKETPVYKGGTGGTDKPEQIGTRSGAGKGVLGKRLSTLYKGKTTPKATKREESTNLKDRMVEILIEKVNPWAVCHSSTGPKKSAKFERCVKDVKKKEGMEEASLKDIMVNVLSQKLTESPMEFNYRRETPEEKAKNKARVEQLRREARAKKTPSGGSKPEADGGEGTKPGSYFTNRHGGRTEN
jgi:hypothetical protein